MRNTYLITFILLFISVYTFGQKIIPLNQRIPLDKSVLIDTLDNGLTYYIKENKEPQQRAELYLVVKAGSLQETENQQGLAHFTEHMAFNGTKNFPKNELIDYLQKAGIRFGADLNAYTGFDQTVYQLPLPTDDDELLESGFKILSDWASAITFDDTQIESERGVVIEEERQRGKNVNDRFNKKIIPVLLEGSKYADRIPIGKTEIIQNFDKDTLRAFYNKWYVPHLQGVLVVGDFDKEKIKTYINKYFSKLKSTSTFLKPKKYRIPDNIQPKIKIVTDSEFPYSVISVLYKHPSKTLKTSADLIDAIKKAAINSMFSARIQELIEKGDAPFLNASASYSSFQGGIGDLDAFSIQVVAKEASKIKLAIEGIMSEVNSMIKFGFKETEWERIKKSFLNSITNSYHEKDKISSKVFINQYLNHFLKGESIISMDYSYTFYSDNLELISVNDLNKMVKTWVSESNQIILLKGAEKDKEILPSELELKEWVNNSNNNIIDYVDDIIDEPLLDIENLNGNITSVKEQKQTKSTEIKLVNGVRVILKSTDFKNDEILFSGFSSGGVSLANKNDVASAKLADNIINSSGVGKFSATQLQKMLSGKTLGVTPYIGMYSEGIKGFSNNNDIETTLQLVHLYMTQPRVDSIVFKTLKNNYKVAIEGKSSNPISVFQDTINYVMKGKGAWAKDLDIVDLEKINLKDVEQFYRERFADASQFTFIFTGSFKKDSLIPLIVKYLGSLPSDEENEKYRDVGIKPLSGKIAKNVYKGLEDKATVVLSYHDVFNFSEKNALVLSALKATLENNLLERLREKESGVYSPSVNLSLVQIPRPYYSFSISFNCATNRVDDLIRATKEEIQNLKNKGLDEDDLLKFNNQKIRQHQLNLRKNSYWLNYFQSVVLYKKDINLITKFDERIDNLKIQEINKKAKKYLNPNNITQLVLYPEMLEELE
ncbi:M16 family metallopeptidase [Lutibacter aestuarii]|uniref:M16 family metallopeptidase n=1 Tax=Lutibacter aestuarii TaxID=861111 RepID=A0ABW2Z4H2_9FLAO